MLPWLQWETEAAGWVLASDTLLSGAYRTTYYGSDEDVGTPGFGRWWCAAG